MKLTFGKYKGYELSKIPEDYLQWGINNLDNDKWREAFKKELDSRPEPTKKQLIERYWDRLEDWERSPARYQECVEAAEEEIKLRELNRQCDALLEKYALQLNILPHNLEQKFLELYPQENFQIFCEFYAEYSKIFDLRARLEGHF